MLNWWLRQCAFRNVTARPTTMHAYTQRVRGSILPLSMADTLPKAFEEWRFTGHYEDHEVPEEICELCGQEGLRYHFEIRNDFTNHRMDVGSHCILKFDLAVYEDGHRLTPDETKKKLQALTQQMRLESCLRALDSVARKETNPILTNALAYYRTNKKLTPKFAFVVFWRMSKHDIDHDPTFFRISLKRSQHKQDLADMATDRVHMFWRALTSSQRKLAREMGHVPPPTAASTIPPEF